jgi:hypothetical protein
MEPEGLLQQSKVPATCPYPEPARSHQSISPGMRLTLLLFRNMTRFYDELLTPLPTPTLEDHPLSAVCDCLFNIFAATLHIGGRSSIRNLRTRHAVVTGIHLPLPANAKHSYVVTCCAVCVCVCVNFILTSVNSK